MKASIDGHGEVLPDIQIVAIPKHFQEDQSNHVPLNLVMRKECVVSWKFAAGTCPRQTLQLDNLSEYPTPLLHTQFASNVLYLDAAAYSISVHCHLHGCLASSMEVCATVHVTCLAMA